MWQMRLLDEGELDSFANERGLTSFFIGQSIRVLWQLGLLHADVIVSPQVLDQTGLLLVGNDDFGNHVYADEREWPYRSEGWLSTASDLEPVSPDVKLYFHPFRYYVLYHIRRILRLPISPLQTLLSAERYPEMVQRDLKEFRQFTGTPQFLHNIASWNSASALAIATEPWQYERLFGVIKYSTFGGVEAQREQIAKHASGVTKCCQAVGLEKIEGFRRDLCLSAEILDPNKNVHTLLRLTPGESRLMQVKGSLGGAMCLLTMAEMLRRAAEEVFSVQLREEDEMGSGITIPGIKKRLYGADRLLDSDRTVKNQFLRGFGLDYGVRLRWYFEGDTEYYAVESLLGRYSAIELINLKGQVAARGGKGVAFRDNVRNDLKTKVFSVVSIDGDRSDNARALRKAAEDDEICGMFFLAEPDFEFENFAISELEEILWGMAVESGAGADIRPSIHSAVKSAKTSEELFAAANGALSGICQLQKGREWGRRLMDYAWDNPEVTDESAQTSRSRRVIEAVNAALGSIGADYHYTRTNYAVDPTTGRLVKRKVEGG